MNEKNLLNINKVAIIFENYLKTISNEIHIVPSCFNASKYVIDIFTELSYFIAKWPCPTSFYLFSYSNIST